MSTLDLETITALDLLTYVSELYDQTPDAEEKMFQLDFLDTNLNMRQMNMFPSEPQQQELH